MLDQDIELAVIKYFLEEALRRSQCLPDSLVSFKGEAWSSLTFLLRSIAHLKEKGGLDVEKS